ncbi:MAG TPA: peptidoglycan DD-metalloendopeptidase family protein [Candidatus Limnocylindria bacterium]|nr:peptidoglycan DD-metalloendopeptidase family protein [Candidatus Limnocylindria bacterium]
MRARVPRTFLAFLLLGAGLPLLGAAAPGVVAEPGMRAVASVSIAAPSRPRTLKPKGETGFRLPFAAGLDVGIAQGWSSSYSHFGRSKYAYDFGLYEGTPVLAAASGVVAFTRSGETKCGGKKMRKHANYVIIDHPDGSATLYGHLSRVAVKVGDVVTVGQQIGRSGKTGYTGCLPHLHFARQAQGIPAARSVPVYFEGFARPAFRLGERVSGPKVECSAAKTRKLPQEAFCATYADITGTALFTRLEAAIDFDWSAGAPGGYWLDKAPGGFSATWAGNFTFEQVGTYSFDTVASDRVQVSVDGELVLDDWGDVTGLHAASATIELSAGPHRIDVRHVDGDGAGILRLHWERLPDDPNRWSRSGPLIR